jgi:PAP2 superfamily
MRGAMGSTATISRDSRVGQWGERTARASKRAGEAAVWRIFIFNWKLLAVITGVVVAVLVTTEFRIEPLGYVVMFAVATLYTKFAQRHRNRKQWNPRVVFSLVAFGQLAFALPVMTTLTYLATAIPLPQQDQLLLAWDLALGLDFRKLLDVVNRHPEVIEWLALSYRSISWQLVAMAVVLPLLGHYRRIGEAVCAFILSLLVTTCISALVPAIGVYDLLHLTPADYPSFEPQGYYDTARDAPLLRAGGLRLLDLQRLVGVLTFPSFHAASAVLYMWAFWPIAWLRPLVVPLNIAMIAATPLGGGHYFVDVIAGVVVTVLAIYASRRIGAFVAPEVSTATLSGVAVENDDATGFATKVTPV